MSGSSSRPKTRKQRNTSEDPQTSILRTIDEKNEVGCAEIVELYRINKPACQGCRINNKDSPNCFCALIPPPGGFRKTGNIWQRLSDIEARIGCNPQELLRPNLNSPSGLTNLGATCYVNSVLQCLYRIKPFIQGFLAALPDALDDQPVLQKLALLFGELRYGKKKAVDSAPLANVLELNNSIQQDGQEFLKLLLSSLESLLGKVRKVIREVFRGTVSHVTRCLKCGQDSAASNQLVDFYELELNVKGLPTLEASLDDYLSIEHLAGDNQFFCESCNARVDATHCSKLRSLPPVLNFQLKRFVYDAKTAAKKKVSSKFSFPETLDMSSRLSVDKSNGMHYAAPMVYEVLALLIHRGSTADSGHYVANIKDDITGEWWEFDDELVTSLGSSPFREPSVFPSKKDIPSKENRAQDEASSSENRLTSADVYTLIYNLRNSSQTVSHSSDDLFCLPHALQSKIDSQNKELEDSCVAYKLRINAELSSRAERKSEIKTILSYISVGVDERFFWISSNWLRTWADELEPPPIDNTELLCKHANVPPNKVNSMKRISEVAWANLLSKYGGGPELSAESCCIDCVIDFAKSITSAGCFKNERMKIRRILEDSGGSSRLIREFYISKTWLQNWFRRKAAEAPADVDANPNAAITCPHKALLPETLTGTKRQAVSEEVWQYFLHIALQLNGNVGDGCISFPVGTPTCSICDAEISEAASQQQNLRAIKMEERQKHELLFSGESIILSPGVTYYLVPSVWLHHWRSYLGETTKKSQKVDEPIGLEECLQDILCQQHGGLLFRPPKLERNRLGGIVESSSDDDTFTIVSEQDWKDLCARWSVNPLRFIGVRVVEDLSQRDTSVTSVVPMPSSEEAEGFQSDRALPYLSTEPDVCDICIEERESSELIRKLQYVDEEIYVDLVEGKEPPKSLLEPLRGDRRVSKRARKGPAASNKRIVLKVSGDTTIYQLKLMIWESFSIVKENQRLHIFMKELVDDSATLSDLNILPGAYLWVIDTGLHENRDIADEVCKQDTTMIPVEEGFSGTLLARLPTLNNGLFTMEESQQLYGDS